MDFTQQATRRQVLRGAGVGMAGLSLPALLSACGSDKSGASTSGSVNDKIASKTVVFAGWGGALQAAQQAIFFTPFERESGVKVAITVMDPAKFRLMAQRGRSQWDLADNDGARAVQMSAEGLLERLPSDATRATLIEPARYQDYANAGYSYSLVQAYNTEKVKPESWADFWDVKKFPGKRSFPKSYGGVAEVALMADGVAPDKLYPLDWDRAFAKLDELRPHMLFADSYGAGAQALQSGAVDMTMVPNGRVIDLQRGGSTVDLVWNQAVLIPWSVFLIPRGAPHYDAAVALSDFMADAQRQADFAGLINLGPTNGRALDLMDERTLSLMPNSPEHRSIAAYADPVYLAKVDEEYAERYTRWLAGS